MTEKLVAMSPPSSKSSAEPVADISADRPDPGGLLARRPVDAGADLDTGLPAGRQHDLAAYALKALA